MCRCWRQSESRLKGQRSLICTQSSALRTFVHHNKFQRTTTGDRPLGYRTMKHQMLYSVKVTVAPYTIQSKLNSGIKPDTVALTQQRVHGNHTEPVYCRCSYKLFDNLYHSLSKESSDNVLFDSSGSTIGPCKQTPNFFLFLHSFCSFKAQAKQLQPSAIGPRDGRSVVLRMASQRQWATGVEKGKKGEREKKKKETALGSVWHVTHNTCKTICKCPCSQSNNIIKLKTKFRSLRPQKITYVYSCCHSRHKGGGTLHVEWLTAQNIKVIVQGDKKHLPHALYEPDSLKWQGKGDNTVGVCG